MFGSTVMLRPVAVFTAFAFLIAVVSPTWPARAQDAASAKPDLTAKQAEYRAVSEMFERFYAGVEAVDKAADKSRFDIDALAEKIGANPKALLAYVQREIAFEPYRGSLRGPRGALAGGAANALDRSLLLAALLKRSGFAVEIARARLGEEQALTLLQRVGQPVPPQPDPLQVDAALLQSLVDATGVKVDEFLGAVEQTEKKSQAVTTELANRAVEDAAFLTGRFKEAGIVMPEPIALETLIPVVSDHFWVRYRDAEGRWIDLDPSFTDFPESKSAAVPHATFAPNAVPGGLVHEFVVRMMLRTADGTTVENHVLIEKRLAVPSLYGVRINIANVPLPALSNTPLQATPLDAVFSDVREIMPVLTVGATQTRGKLFNARGDVFNSLPGTDTGNAERLARSQGNTWDIIGNKVEGKTSNSRIVEQWVEYELASSTVDGARAVRSERRSIYSAPPASRPEREAENMQNYIWSADLLPIAGSMTADQLGHLQLASALAGRDAAMAQIRQMMGLPVDTSAIAEPNDLPISLALFVTTLSEQLRVMLPARFPNLTMVWDRPQLVAFETAIVQRPGEPTSVAQGYDIVALAPLVITREPAGDAITFAATFGAFANALEWSLVKNRFDLIPDKLASPIANTGEVIRAAIAQNVDIITLQPEDNRAVALARLKTPPGEAERISKALDEGHVVIVPTASVMVAGVGEPWFGWWKANQVSGEIIGVMQGGRGLGGLSEKATLEARKKTDAVHKLAIALYLGVLTLSLCVYGTGADFVTDSAGRRAGPQLDIFFLCLVGGASAFIGVVAGTAGVAVAGIIGLLAALMLIERNRSKHQTK